MSDVSYTHFLDGGTSSLVDEVFYNENTQDLYVDLDDNVYLYKYVPASVFALFKAAASKGTYYNTSVKGKWGGGELIGTYPDLDYEKVSVVTPATTINAGSIQTGSIGSGLITVGDVSPTVAVVPPEANVSLVPFKADTEAAKSKYTVRFEVEGNYREQEVQATSVDDAIASIEEFAKMLDLTFVVKSVTVYFE